MQQCDGFYALIQFSPVPERFEFVNVGVMLVVPNAQFVGFHFVQDFRRVDKVFGYQPKSYLRAVLEGLENRVRLELRSDLSRERLSEFSERRANGLRISKLQPVLVEEPTLELDRLFKRLVGEIANSPKRQRVSAKLRDQFKAAGVIHFLDEPKPVELPEFGLRVDAQYGYQNGAYNLVDAMRLGPTPGDALREAGKRAIEGQLLHQHGKSSGAKMRLIVVGDVVGEEGAFYRTVEDIMRDHSVTLYRMDQLQPLVDDIKHNARLHA